MQEERIFNACYVRRNRVNGLIPEDEAQVSRAQINSGQDNERGR